MGDNWKVESRKICDCGKPITAKKSRKFCSVECRIKSYRGKYQEHRSKYQRERKDAIARVPSPNKVKCLVCGRHYVQVGTHIVQRHQMTAREYREYFELPIKRGILPTWYRQEKAESAMERGGVENLKKGKKFWYKKGDKRAIVNTGYKGRMHEVKKLSQDIYPH